MSGLNYLVEAILVDIWELYKEWKMIISSLETKT